MTWRLRLVGTPAAARGAESVPLSLERRWQLVAVLALRGDWMQRSELAALLWPDLPRALASTNLRKALFRLRDSSWLPALQADGVLLRCAIATDVDAFAAQVREDRLGEALAAHRGELLAGFDDDANEGWTEWLRTQRERWRNAWRTAALQRLAQPLADDEGLALSTALLDADPLDEAALQAQLEHLCRTGQTTRAREIYRAFTLRLQQELGVQPGSALRAAHERLQAHPLAPAAPPSGDDRYVGRVVEQRRIAELMGRVDCRLLVVVGPGGVGKTRLVRRALEDVAPQFEDGATFVALEDVETTDGFLSQVARSLEVAGPHGSDVFESLIEYLGTRHVLLVLDNFEPIAATATPLLGRMLDRAPRLKLLVTSRERLALGAQWALPLDGLPCPEPEDMDRLDDFDASRLFIAAARRADPTLDPRVECAAIVDICRQVEGLPLALELAAAWTRMMRCADIARELRQGAEILRATNPAFPARQASLEAVFEQSWRLLGERERQALARLSVFRGGLTVQAAQSVAAAPLPILGALIDKSLLRKDGGRLILHPLVHQFAQLRLDADGARSATEAAHASHFHHWLQHLEPDAAKGERAALQAIDADFDNCRRAWAVSLALGRADDLMRSLPTLLHYFEDRARFEDGVALMRQGMESRLGQTDAALRARLLALQARMQLRLGRYADAEAAAGQALAAARSPGEREVRYHALAVMAGSALFAGRPAEARRTYHRALKLARSGARPSDVAATLDNLALCEKRLGNYQSSLQLTLEASSQHRRHGDHARLAVSLNNLASLRLFMDEDDAARADLQEALTLSERHGHVSSLAFVLANLTDLAFKSGDLEAARRHAQRALEVADGASMRSLAAWLRVQLARLASRRGDATAAASIVGIAAAESLALGAPQVQAAVLLAFGELLEAGGRGDAARRVLAFGANDPSLSEPDRDELRAAWVRRAASAAADPPWPALDLPELLRRIAGEASQGHAALGALLGA